VTEFTTSGEFDMSKQSLQERQSERISDYFREIRSLLDRIVTTQSETIESAASLISKSILSGGTVHYTGCGHSHMLAVEMMYRCGGLAIANAILEPAVMLHELPPTKGAKLEKLDGYGQIIIENAPLRQDDTLVVISNSGVNSVPVEMALSAKLRGLTVIALTSMEYTTSVPPRHKSGKKLYQIADVVLDNCGVLGDATVMVEGLPAKVGPTSTIAGAFILTAVTNRVVRLLLESGVEPPVLMNAQLPGAEGWNQRIFAEWRDRIRY
jgi:uncharacterized phosphosugar-binding protein